MDTQEYEKRKTLIHLIRSGKKIQAASEELGRCRSWGNKWWRRFRVNRDWEDLRDYPRTPKRQPRRLPLAVRQAIRRVRSELEAEAQQADRLSYIGAHAVRARLQARDVKPVPGITSIERELRAAGMVRSRQKKACVEVQYPHLHPTQPHELIQADILPKYLTGGAVIACFNAIDVVSRYPSGLQFASATARNACDFLWRVWQEQGIPDYQQVDNEGCFSGGFTHPGVLGKVLRLGLMVGTQLVFSPFYHPESNGFVERFHQDYADFVWKKELLPDLPAVRQRSALFCRNYRASHHHSQLQGRSPAECHQTSPIRKLPEGFCLPERLPLTAGQVHFLRKVDDQRQVKVLNLDWNVPKAQPHQGVWVTLNIASSGVTLSIFDVAPDVSKRTCLAKYPFPNKEKVVPLAKEFQPQRQRLPAWFKLTTRTLGYLAYRLSTMS